MRTMMILCLLNLSACSLSTGGLYMGTGSHPHVNFAAKATIGPAELLLAPTTQRGAHDLFALGLYPTVGDDFRFTVGGGWAWWRAWGACDATGHACEHTWADGITAGAGVVYVNGIARVDVRGQVFADAPYDAALLFTVGLTHE